MNETEKTIYELDLHEQLWVSAELTIVRVASGWNYMYYVHMKESEINHGDWTLHQIVFVPFDNRFQIAKNVDITDIM